jgi:hypothetical protein
MIVVGSGLDNLIALLGAASVGRLPGSLICRLPARIEQITVAPDLLTAVSDSSWCGTRRGGTRCAFKGCSADGSSSSVPAVWISQTRSS